MLSLIDWLIDGIDSMWAFTVQINQMDFDASLLISSCHVFVDMCVQNTNYPTTGSQADWESRLLFSDRSLNLYQMDPKWRFKWHSHFGHQIVAKKNSRRKLSKFVTARYAIATDHDLLNMILSELKMSGNTRVNHSSHRFSTKMYVDFHAMFCCC